MPTTIYKGYSVQTASTNTGTWGAGASTSLNEGVFEIADRNLGGIVTKSLSSSNVTLDATESQNAIVRLTGVLLANVQITTACQGSFFVENLTTGSFAVTVTNGVSGVVVPQGTRATLIADATNGVRISAQYLGFVGGTTKMVFNNVTVPTGWLIDATTNNGTFRLVSGTGGGSGGTADFTTALGARTIAVANLPDHNVTITDPTHQHTQLSYASLNVSGTDNGVNPNTWRNGGSYNQVTLFAATGITAAFGTPARGGAQTTMDFAVKYVDCVRGTLNG